MKHKLRATASLLGLAVLLMAVTACSTTPKPQTLPPGALNQFDATTYTTLMGAQAVLNSIKADKDKLPVSALPMLKKAAMSYNAAEATWQAYHAGKMNDQAALTAAITQATTDVASLLTQWNGGK